LANVLLEATDGTLVLTATDFEIAIRASGEAEVLQPGRLTLNARRMYDIVRELPDEAVHLVAQQEYWAGLTCGKASFRFAGMPADEFPPLPAYDAAQAVKLPPGAVGEMVAKTLYAVSTDETRYVLNGVLLSLAGKTLEMVATDGHRLAQIVEDSLEPVGEPLQVVVPRKALHELARLLEPETETLEIVLQESHVVFLLPGVVLVGRLIEGQFPNYDQVIPPQGDVGMTVGRQVFIHALKRVSLMASDKSKMVKLTLARGTLSLASEETEIGSAQEELAAAYDGDEFVIGLNARYLLEALNAMETEEVAMGFTDPLAPGLLEPVDGGRYKCVIMPMRL
ncbi:MAG: DNA polymerase III subunit beta, partial [Nitrospinota bacterium]